MKNPKLFIIIALSLALLLPDIAEAYRGGRGGSFGSRRSMSSRSYSRPSSSRPSYSSSPSSGVSRAKSPSFGGSRTTRTDYTNRYGVPRRTSTYTGTNGAGMSQNYRVNDYGGYSSGLMMGYMQGSIASHMMWLPWYGAFWYTQPHYSDPDADGIIEVYPPTFNYTKLIFMIIIVGLIGYFVYSRIRRRRYGYGEDSRSSFS